MKNVFNLKAEVELSGSCLKHGDWNYPVAELVARHSNGQCPECFKQQLALENKAATDEQYSQALALARQKMRDKFTKAAIPKRYLNRTFANYKNTDNKQKQALKITKDYANNFAERLENGSGLILQGKPGTGKTHLACAIANQVIVNGYSARFTTVMQLVRAIRATWKRDSERTEDQVLDAIIGYDLLIIDEIGVQYESESEKLILFDVLNGRYENVKPTILLTNLVGVAVNTCIGERNVDRITEGGGSSVSFTWQSYREHVFGDDGLRSESCAEVAVNQIFLNKNMKKE